MIDKSGYRAVGVFGASDSKSRPASCTRKERAQKLPFLPADRQKYATVAIHDARGVTMKLALHAMATVFLASACTTGSAMKSPDAAFLQAAESPADSDGKVVTVRAWMTLRHEDRNLWATWRDHESWETTRCISLSNFDSLDASLDGRYVEVTGVMRKDASNEGRLLRLGACREVAIEVSGPDAVKLLK